MSGRRSRNTNNLMKVYISNFLYGTIKFRELKNDMAFIQGALAPDVKIWQTISITDYDGNEFR